MGKDIDLGLASEDRYLSEVVRFTVAASGISTDGRFMRAVGG